MTPQDTPLSEQKQHSQKGHFVRSYRAPIDATKLFVAKKKPLHTKSKKRSNYGSKKNYGQRRMTQGALQHRTSQKKEDVIPPLAPGDIRIIPLGGVEEIGKNMTMVEYRDQIVVIDAGIEFTDMDTPGIDYIIPNTRYLEERREKIVALVITHGHLDHIGSIPYLVEKLGNPPIYTREFGGYLIQKRHEEFPHLPPLNLKMVTKDDGSIPLSPDFKVRFFGLTHSIPDSTGVILETPHGDIVSTGDVRVDNYDGIPTEEEVEQYKIFKDRNVLLMTMDSTGIPYPGWSLSETVVTDTLDTIIRDVPGRLIIATFASQVERIMKFIESAKRYGKYVVVEGRSMKTNISIVKHLNLTPLDHVIPVEEMHQYPPHKIVMLATGAQGEEFAALNRMAQKTHKYVTLTEHDTIVFSSSVIPGNEPAVTKLKDSLYRHDPRIITYRDSDVHTSGHGKRGELEWIHRQINYKFFMPVHGYHHMIKMHRDLVESLGVDRERIVVPDNGTIVEIRNNGSELVRLDAKAPSETVTIDGTSIGDIQDVVIRDRKALSEAGMFVVVVSVDPKTKKLKKSPDIISRGFIYLRENQELLHKTRGLIKKVTEEAFAKQTIPDHEAIKEVLAEKISKFLLQKTAKSPIVIPVVLH